MSQDIGTAGPTICGSGLFVFRGWVRVVVRWAGSRVVGSRVSSRRSSPVAALTTRMSRSWTSRMTWVRAWVRPMPMWCRRPLMAQGDVAGVSTVSWRTRSWVSVLRSGRGGFGAGRVGGRRGGAVRQGAVRAVVVVVVDEGVEEGLQLGEGGWAGRVGRGATSSGSAGSVRPCRRWWGGWGGSSSGRCRGGAARSRGRCGRRGRRRGGWCRPCRCRSAWRPGCRAGQRLRGRCRARSGR